MPGKTLIYSGIFSVLFLIMVIAIFSLLPNDTWQIWQPATCLQTNCFCEAVSATSSVRQPVNTWSSMSFAFGGIFIILSVAHGRKNSAYPDFFPYAFGFSSIIVGIGSAFYHASLTFTGQFFDIFGMYLITSLMLMYALKRLYEWDVRKTVLVYIFVNISLTIIQILVPDTRRYVFAVVLIVALIFEAIYRRRSNPEIETKWLNLGLGLFAFAFFIWILDNAGIVCSPNSVFQGHALWHILGAVALVFLDKYYFTEAKLHLQQD